MVVALAAAAVRGRGTIRRGERGGGVRGEGRGEGKGEREEGVGKREGGEERAESGERRAESGEVRGARGGESRAQDGGPPALAVPRRRSPEDLSQPPAGQASGQAVPVVLAAVAVRGRATHAGGRGEEKVGG